MKLKQYIKNQLSKVFEKPQINFGIRDDNWYKSFWFGSDFSICSWNISYVFHIHRFYLDITINHGAEDFLLGRKYSSERGK